MNFGSFFSGRYGMDNFNRFLMILGLVLSFLSMIVRIRLFYTIGVIIWIFALARAFSRAHGNRARENQWFMAKTALVRNFFWKKKTIRNEKKYNHIFKCPSCGQHVRVPKGKGKIEIKCPRCGGTFVKKS